MATVKNTFEKTVPRISNVDLKSLGIRSYDSDNMYPQRMIDVVNDSGTAKTSLKIFKKFVKGSGLKNTEFGKLKINEKGLTVNKFFSKFIDSYSMFTSVAIHFNYNGLGQKVSIDLVPFEYARIAHEDSKTEGKIAIYDDWSHVKRTKFIKSEVKYIYKYDPANVLLQVKNIEVDEAEIEANLVKGEDLEMKIKAEKFKKFGGQVLYWTPRGSNEYPLAPFDAVVEDMQTEAQVKRFKKNTSGKNFLASHILITGVEEDKIKAEAFAENLKSFQGGDGAGTILWLERESDEETIELTKVEIQKYDGLYEYTENSSQKNIRETFLVPEVLLAKANGGIGESKQLSDASRYYNEITEDDRDTVEEILREVFSGWFYDINPEEEYSIIPLKFSRAIEKDYFQFYSEDEIRVANGDEPRSVSFVKEDTPIGLTLSPEGIDSMTKIMTDQNLSDDNKKGSLMVMFGLNQEQADQMLGGEKKR